MLRFTYLLAFLFTLTACQETNTTADVGVTADEPQTALSETGEEVEEVVEGENYRVTTVDGSIKSPRKELEGTVGEVNVKINYGSPAVNGRKIYGELVPYNKVWRTGANEATRITFEQPVTVGAEGKQLEAGTYALFTRPTNKNEWAIIFNKKADQWGAYDYEDKDDVAVITGTAKEAGGSAERMDFSLAGDEVQLMWAEMVISFPVKSAAK